MNSYLMVEKRVCAKPCCEIALNPQDKFKAGLLTQSEEFKKQVVLLLEEFRAKGPFGSHIQIAAAFASIASFKEQLQQLREDEASLRKGLAIFKIDLPPSKDIAKTEGVRF
jgi:dynein heavy chain, axonemal